jgi:NSS family neurotransmitter:Na+ symporter
MAGSAGSGEQWSSRWGFLLAAVGFAVGMGNIWRFPYVLGENGGSAFLFIYLAFALGIGLPLLVTEIAIGRRGQCVCHSFLLHRDLRLDARLLR